MLCTKCGGVVVPVVALDIDGTLGDYHGHFLRFAEQWLGQPWDGNAFRGQCPFRDWFADAFDTDVTTFRRVKLAYRQGGMKRTMPLRSGVRELVTELGRAGVEVWFTTTRPWERYDAVDPDTREWLRRNRLGGVRHLLFSDDKLGELARQVDPTRVVAVLDDELEQLEVADDLGLGLPVHMRTPYNAAQQWRGVTALDMQDAGMILRNTLEEWNIQHEQAA